MHAVNSLPDITFDAKAHHAHTLDWVGMEGIALPIALDVDGSSLPLQAKVDVFVSLDNAQQKGIHMSRLYRLLQARLANHTVTDDTLIQLLDALINSQAGHSHSAKCVLRFAITKEQSALLSDLSGYQQYDLVWVCQNIQGTVRVEKRIEVGYSSTCPCSAALSRSALKDAVMAEFGQSVAGSGRIDAKELLSWLESDKGSVATPHSQRSLASIHIQHGTLNQTEQLRFGFSTLIAKAEHALQTRLQTAVKREDEQAFAQLNANNLMFCEDAARRLVTAFKLNQGEGSLGYFIKVAHFESLHAHDAVAYAKSPDFQSIL